MEPMRFSSAKFRREVGRDQCGSGCSAGDTFDQGSFIGLMIVTSPPRPPTRDARSDVPPGPSPVGFSSQMRSE